MNQESPDSRDIPISGDTLALDPGIRQRINIEAEKLQKRYPESPLSLRVGICEEFDPAYGHRIRCELAADLAGRRQVMVREAQKDPFTAIARAFTTAKKQLRRLGSRPSGQNETVARRLPLSDS